MRTFVPDRTCWSLLLTALAIRLRYKPTYDKLQVLIINKDVHKSLARKNGNEIPIWSWNNSPVSSQKYKGGGVMDKPVFDIALRIITQIKRITTTEVNDFVGTFVMKLRGVEYENLFFKNHL